MRFRKYLFEIQNEIEFTEEMEKNIYQINVDYLHSTNINLMVEKALRRYQGKHKLTIIVLTGTSKSGKVYREQMLNNDKLKDLKYKDRIFVLNKEEFARFIGLKGSLLSGNKESYFTKFKEGSELFQQAIWNSHKVDELRSLSDENREFLEKEFLENFGEDGSTSGWLKYLKDIGLLEEVVKDNPYPYEDKEQTNEDNFIGDR